MANDAATVVLVHGAWHGAWCWDLVARRLDAAGVANISVDNPSVARAPCGPHDDADNVRRVLDEIDGPVVLVGHSYGGAIITDAGAHDAVRHLVYITAFVLDDGESVTQNALSGGELGSRLDKVVRVEGDFIHIDGVENAIDALYHDCADDVARAAVRQLRAQTIAALTAPTREVAWRSGPATYIVCTEDRGLPTALQQSCAARLGGDVIEMPTSHSPFLSRPDDVAEVLRKLAE